MAISTMVSYPSPVGGASLMLAFKPLGRTVLILGSGPLAAARAFVALEADANVIIGGYGGVAAACEEIQWRTKMKQVEWLDLPQLAEPQEWQLKMTRLIDSLDDLMIVCVTDTLVDTLSTEDSCITSARLAHSQYHATLLAQLCRSRHLPINVTDAPHLCDFTFPAAHRFAISGSTHIHPSHYTKPGSTRPSQIQLAVTTNGTACRLAARIRRELVASLPNNVGLAVENVGIMRQVAQDHDRDACLKDKNTGVAHLNHLLDGEEEDSSYVSINTPVAQQVLGTLENDFESAKRRMRWVSQMSEYWPLDKLAMMTREDMEKALQRRDLVEPGDAVSDPGARKRSCPKRRPFGMAPTMTTTTDTSNMPKNASPLNFAVQTSTSSLAPGTTNTNSSSPGESTDLPPSVSSRHSIDIPDKSPPKKGKILLIGSGPGHPSLLTLAAHKALTQVGTLILSDKLVPTQVLDLVPKGTSLYIAKKFPGNAEGAQNELMDMALEGLERGEVVVRLKQGDPFLYGRGGEEVLFFRSHGYEPLVIPGISSALAAPLLTGIPVTQRGVSESLMICTGVGRRGKEVELPGYQRERSLSILMGVARLGQIVQALTVQRNHEQQEATPAGEGRRKGDPYPSYTPIAIVERASCPDQRIISSTLGEIETMLQRCGEQRPPAMMLVGWAVLALAGEGNLGVLDDAAECAGNSEMLQARDIARVDAWLGEGRCIIKEGLPPTWDLL